MGATAKRGSGTLRHRMKERGLDCYQTPVEATRALLAVEKLPKVIWEPACGPGAIVRELRAAGHFVVASDIHDYGWGHLPRIDFTMLHGHADIRWNDEAGNETELADIGAIVTNPPYGIATDFARAAISMSAKVCLLCEVNFLASQGRIDLVNRHLARVFIFGRRLPTMHREGWTGKKSDSDKNHAWFVFERDHDGPATVHSIDWHTLNGGADSTIKSEGA